MLSAGLSCLQVAHETGGLFQLLEGSGTYDALVPIAVVTAERELDRQLFTARCADLVQFPSMCARNPPTSARGHMCIEQKAREMIDDTQHEHVQTRSCTNTACVCATVCVFIWAHEPSHTKALSSAAAAAFEFGRKVRRGVFVHTV